MEKARDAFRTISEVANWLETPAHVLRFWESKFTHVKPVKRAGGRRYYRPSDMKLLGGIKKLLHEDGMTIKGVQKILREEGVKQVAALSQPLHFDDEPTLDRDEKIIPFSEPPIEATAEEVAEEIAPEIAETSDAADAADTVAPEAARPDAAAIKQDEAAPADPLTVAPEVADVAEPAPAAEADVIPPTAESSTETPVSETTADSAPGLDATPAPKPMPEPAASTPALMPDPLAARLQHEKDPEDDEVDAPVPVSTRLRAIDPGQLAARRDRIAPLYERLKSLRSRMGA